MRGSEGNTPRQKYHLVRIYLTILFILVSDWRCNSHADAFINCMESPKKRVVVQLCRRVMYHTIGKNSMFARLGTDYKIRNQWVFAILEAMTTDWDLSQWTCNDRLQRTAKEKKRKFISIKSLPIYEGKNRLQKQKLKPLTLFHLMNQDQINNYLIPTHR